MSGKVKYHQLTEAEKKKYLGEFYTMVSLLRTRDEVKNFFRDLLTLSEIVMISRRIQVARMLLEGHTNRSIRERLNIGLSTINQVNKWLNNGFGGYKKVIKEFKKNKQSAKNKFAIEYSDPFSLSGLRKRYPGHFLLLNLLAKNKFKTK
jgi:TrpR-related protein YerC/YecD